MSFNLRSLSLVVLVATACGGNGDEEPSTQGGSGGIEEQGGAGGETTNGGKGGTAEASGGSGGSVGGAQGGGGGSTTPATGGTAGNATGGAAGSSTGGTSGTAGTGGAPIAASPCAHAACQDFESDNLAAAGWSLSFSGGTATVVKDTVTALRGPSKALKLHMLKTNAEASAKAFATLKTVPTAIQDGGGDLFARFYTYFSLQHDHHHTYMFRAATPAEGTVEFGGQTGNKWILAPPGKVAPPTGSIPVKKWFCVEAQFKKATGELKLLVDGQQVATASNAVAGAFNYRYFQFGFGTYHEVTADLDMYIDDIAMDVKPVGCLP